MNALQSSIACLEAAIARMRKWRLNRSSRRSIGGGLQQTYRQGRQAFAMACDHPTTEHLHEGRKKIKYLGQALEVWGGHNTVDVLPLVKRAEKLADLLGFNHDLAVFLERLNMLDAPHAGMPAITNTIADQRAELLDKALKKGRRLFKTRPRSFLHNIAH